MYYKKNSLYLIVVILLFLVIYKTNFLKSFYNLLMNNYDERISSVYGFCDREGIGYVNFIKKKFNINGKIQLRNSLKKSNNTSGEWSVYNPNFTKEIEPNYLIIINHEKMKNKINLNNHKILHNFKDCYFLTKKWMNFYK